MHSNQGMEKLREDPAKAGATTGLATAPRQRDQPGETSQDMLTTAASGGPSRPPLQAYKSLCVSLRASQIVQPMLTPHNVGKLS